MNNIYKKLSALLAVFAMVLFSAPSAQAQLQWQDDFEDYAADSDLRGQGSWMQYGSYSTNPMKVVAETLEYESYPGGVKGKSIKLDPGTPDNDYYGNSQRLYTIFSDYADTGNKLYGITSGSVYFSALVKVNSVVGNNQYIASFVKKSSATSELGDTKQGAEAGKLFVSPGSDAEHFKFGVNATPSNTKITAYVPDELECGKTYLVVMKYTINEALNGYDGLSLIVNPTDFTTEPEPTAEFDGSSQVAGYGIKTNYSGAVCGLQGLEIRQTSSSTTAGVDALIGAIRVADTYAGLFPAPAVAQWGWQWQDDFDYAAGSELRGQGGWMNFGTTTTGPVKVTESTLEYEGYPGGVKEKSIKLEPGVAEDDYYGAYQKVFALFNEDADTENQLYGITSGSVYFSALVKVNSVVGTNQYIASFVKKSSATTALGDNKTGAEAGKLFVSPGSDAEHFKFGVNATTVNSKVTAYVPDELECGKTYLIVMKYTINEALNGYDGLSLIVNPTDFTTEPEPTVAFDGSSQVSGYGIKKNYSGAVCGLQGITLRQTSSGVTAGVDAEIGAVHLSDTYVGLFQTSAESNTAKVMVAPGVIDYGTKVQGSVIEQVITVRGKDLKGDITASVPEGSNVTLSATTIPANEAMTEEGYTLTATISINNATQTSATVTFSAEGAKDAAATFSWAPLAATQVANLKEFYAARENTTENTLYHLGSEVVITHISSTTVTDFIDGDGSTHEVYTYYVQDETGGALLYDRQGELQVEYKVGDRISNFAAYGVSGSAYDMESSIFIPIGYRYGTIGQQFGTVVSENNTVEPIQVTLADLASNPAEYFNRVVRVEDVEVKGVIAGAAFEENTKLTLTDGTNEASLKLFGGSPLVGKDVPVAGLNLTGISTSLSAAIVQPRTEEDIEALTPDYGTFNWHEDFEFRGGDLVGKNSWKQYSAAASNKVTVENTSLAYEGFPGELVGGSVVLKGNYSDGSSIQKAFKEFSAEGISQGTIYYSTLVNVEKQGEVAGQHLMALVASKNAIEEGKTGTEVACLFTTPGTSTNTYKIGVAREKTGMNSKDEFVRPSYAAEELEMGKTYLVVVKYEINAAGDKATLYVNPASYTKEPEEATATHQSNVALANGTAVRYIEVRQTQTSSYNGVNAKVAAIRVSDSYAGLFRPIEYTPSIDVESTPVALAEGKVGETTEAGKMNVLAFHLTAPVKFEFTGAAAAQFGTSVAEIPAGNSNMDIAVNYQPTEIGKHAAYLMMTSEDETLTLPDMMKLSGIAYDPSNLPTVTLEPAEIPAFEATNIGETAEQTITVKSANLPDYGKVSLKVADGNFKISTTMVMKDSEGTSLKISFTPTAAGELTDTLVFTAYGMDTLEVEVKGTGVDPNPVVSKEGDELPLDPSNPLTLLNEKFDGAEHNQPLSIEGWKNLAVDGTRAWWGYEFPETDASAGEKVAKVTPYDSQVETGEGTPCQMILVTPALDYKNAASKMFTFRVRGDYLADGQSDLLELVYLTTDGEEIEVTPVEGFLMPETAEEAGEWQEYHVDLTDLELDDVFFMGFRFTSTRGTDNAATYYIDDVTYGRTDLPVVTPSAYEVVIAAEPGEDAVSSEIEVSAVNLTEPVTLSLIGADKGKFSLSTTELPVEGGAFTVTFNDETEGEYEVAVKISSRGAADKYVSVIATNITGIASTEAATTGVTVYDASGRKVLEDATLTPVQAAAKLPAGIYLVKSGNKVTKIQVR